MIRDYIKGRRQALASGEDTEIGIGGFRFFARVSDNTNYTATVPTVTLEDGSKAADHIINDLLTMTISGEVSNEYIELTPVPEQLQALSTSVGQISAFLPNRTQSQINKIQNIGQSVMDAVDKVDRVINTARDGFNALTGGGDAGKLLQEQFIDFIESVYYGKQLIAVDAAYRTHDRMAITSLAIARNNEDDTVRFEMSLQQVPITKLVEVDISEFYQEPAPGQTESTTAGASDEGSQEADEGKTKSLASSLLGR